MKNENKKNDFVSNFLPLLIKKEKDIQEWKMNI